MLNYIIRRLFVAVPVLLLISIIVFLLVHLLPGDPATVMLGEESTPEMIQALRAELGLDQPLHKQYLQWLTRCLSGDFGRSIQTRQPVSEALVQRLPVTIELTLLGFCVSIMIALPIAVASAVRPNSWIDVMGSAFATIGISMPSFWLGILLIYAFAVSLHLLPASGYVPLRESVVQNLLHMVLPAFTLGMWLSASAMRMIRAGMIDVLERPYIRTARAKGLSERRVLWHHALKNAFIPVVTILGLQLGRLMGGAVVTETIFAQPGVGQLAVKSIFMRDFPPVQAIVLVMAISMLLSSLVVDILYSFLDPRIRLR
ncbi:MAG: ABC transporter permease [Deltaproteobacteria bacterium]|nr:ABC transporter permease [Deltaproteobacteria bacterium]MBW2120625.1 ABC transporter permease [Deltaproteobacteria bacterium]